MKPNWGTGSIYLCGIDGLTIRHCLAFYIFPWHFYQAEEDSSTELLTDLTTEQLDGNISVLKKIDRSISNCRIPTCVIKWRHIEKWKACIAQCASINAKEESYTTTFIQMNAKPMTNVIWNKNMMIINKRRVKSSKTPKCSKGNS